jgi:type IV pilus assembly protein PilA
MKKHQRAEGFSLIELLIVVAIIGIIASIAIPNLLASRRAANEGSPQQSLRTIYSPEVTYQTTAGGGQFGTLANLGSQSMVDSVVTSAATTAKSGYLFTVNPVASTAGPPPTPALLWAYCLPAVTSGVGKTGTRRFAITEDGVLRGDTTLTAPANEAAINGATPMSPVGN